MLTLHQFTIHWKRIPNRGGQSECTCSDTVTHLYFQTVSINPKRLHQRNGSELQKIHLKDREHAVITVLEVDGCCVTQILGSKKIWTILKISNINKNERYFKKNYIYTVYVQELIFFIFIFFYF